MYESKTKNERLIRVLILTMIFVMITGCKSRDTGDKSVSGTGFYFDTVVSFTVYGTDNKDIINELKAECARYEKIFSPTDTESELYKLNHQEIDMVSKDLFYCVQQAIEYCRLLDGRYDISIRPVCEQWDFHGESNSVPDEALIESNLKYVDYSEVKLIEASGDFNLQKSEAEDKSLGEYRISLNEGMMLDLGSVAKGYVADKLCEYLSEKGYKSAVISLGGNVQCLGSKPGKEESKESFRVAVKSPFPNDEQFAEIVNVKDKAVVTSGIYERCFEKDGVLYHHILDAKTGYPVNNDLASVTIICESGLESDILSTVLFIAGYEDVPDLREKMSKISGFRSFEAEFIYKDGTVKQTENFTKYLS